MKFELSIECNNAAFCDDDGDPDPGLEVGRILKELTKDVEQRGGGTFKLYDVNGNVVGYARFIEE